MVGLTSYAEGEGEGRGGEGEGKGGEGRSEACTVQCTHVPCAVLAHLN